MLETTSYPNKKVPIRDLQLADVVQCFDGAFGTGTVTKIDGEAVYIERPYGHSLDFAYTGGVITLIGHESIVYCRDTNATLHLWQRKELR